MKNYTPKGLVFINGQFSVAKPVLNRAEATASDVRDVMDTMR